MQIGQHGAEGRREVVDAHRMMLRADLYVGEVRLTQEEGVELGRDAAGRLVGKGSGAASEHQQEAIRAGDQHIIRSDAARDEVGGDFAYSIAFL